MAVDTNKLCEVILGVLIPPVLAYMKKNCQTEFWISLVLWLFLVTWPVSIIYTFYISGYVDILMNVLCCLIPPIAAFLRYKVKPEFWISLILWIFAFVPSIIYTYYLTW